MSNRKLEDDGIFHSLTFGREFLSDESRWCKNVHWRDKDGRVFCNKPDIKHIHSACILGAVSLGKTEDDIRAATYIDKYWLDTVFAVGLRVDDVPTICAALSYWNDNVATHKDVLKFLDDAIEHRKVELLEKVSIAG